MVVPLMLSCLIGCGGNVDHSSSYRLHDDFAHQVVIDLKDNLSTAEVEEFAHDYNLTLHPTPLYDSTREEIADLGANDRDALLDRLHKDSRVEIAEPLTEVHASMTPNDPMFKDQWGMQKVNAETAWNYTTGRGVTVAVIDTGVACYDRDGFHKLTDLQQTECVPGWNFIGNNDLAADDYSHGSHVAGTIAQSTNNGVGAVGLAHHARIMPVKVLNGSGSGSNAGVADGIRWAADHGAQVINMSLGGGPNSPIMQKSITYAISRGVTVVAAAGNSGGKIEFPGGSDGVIGVSATEPSDALAKFSCRGEGIDLGAPGTGILQQTICDGGKKKCEEYKAYNGTSMASPHVAGAAALVVSMGVSNPDKVEQYLRDSARKLDDSESSKNLYGSGILDAGAAVRLVTFKHAMWRIIALLGLTAYLGFTVKRRGTSPWNLKFLLGALIAGPGLFFFAPLVLPRSEFIVDLLARPFADMDLMLVGQSLHRWLPLATVLVPFALTTICLGHRTLRQMVAGLSVGTAAYLAAAIYLNENVSPLGHAATVIWMAANAVGCLWVARQNLDTSSSDKTADVPPTNDSAVPPAV